MTNQTDNADPRKPQMLLDIIGRLKPTTLAAIVADMQEAELDSPLDYMYNARLFAELALMEGENNWGEEDFTFEVERAASIS